MIQPSITKPITILYLGSLTHSDQTSFLDKTKPHQDQIDLQTPTKISLIRIPRPGKDIYSKHISITQTQSIKNFEIYFRNLEKTTGRFSLLTSINQLSINLNDDILITSKQPIYTDLILIKGNFMKLTLCIYGNVIKDDQLLNQKCPNYLNNAPIEPISQNLIQMYNSKINQFSKKDVFEEKRELIKQLENEKQIEIDELGLIVNDDGINEQQIENICNLSQKLLTTYNNQRLSQENFVVQFRAGIQQISANLAKIFKNKHLGLYYPSFQDSNISNDLSLSVTRLALNSLDLSLSEQVRGLQILKFMIQLDRHADFFIDNHGVEKVIKIFINFFKINSVVLSTYKNLCLQVLITVSHWKKAAQKMTSIIKNYFYHEIFEGKIIQVEKMSQQRERSRQKKAKQSRSQSSSSSGDQNKKKKKSKQKKRNKSRQKKKGKQSKSKQQLLKKPEEQKQEPIKPPTLRDQIPNISFYQILLFVLAREKSSKQLILIKILLEQILQTITKDPIASQRVALSTSLLKDLKYVFNPSGQVLNTKSLKQFASCYQPFLNNLQSQGVESNIISEKEKLKNMEKYGIDSKVCKIIGRIALQIASSQCEENEDEIRTPYDSSFIVMMSQLIRSNKPSVLYGFGRILSSFRVSSLNDIIYLKRIQGAMTMISEYIYKILIEDQGLYTVLNIDQIYTALINITNCLSKDPSAFTKELKRKIRQLTNYAMAYDLFTSSEGNFKTISDYFLRQFKFEHYEINKISDYKKKQFDRVSNPYSINNLSEVINLGNFQELFPEQPLLEIDVYLKIFNIVLQYNKNVWPLFYENKLVCGFSVLYVRLSNVIIFLLQSGIERDTILLNLKKIHLTVENYLNVMLRLIKILAKKADYEAAFNDLIDEDNFQNVETYEKTFQLYVTLFNGINQVSSLLNSNCKKLAQQIIAKILEIYDKLLESYQLTSHVSKESKIKELWLMIYENHFIQLKSRAACLSLFSFFAESVENVSLKLFNTFCLEQSLKIESSVSHGMKGYIPRNQKSLLQNLILSNIYRANPIVQNNLTLLIKNIVEKHSQKNPIIEKITPFLENIFDDIQSKLKEKGNFFENSKDLMLLEKMVLLTYTLKKLNCVFTIKFEQKLIKFLKSVDLIRRDSLNQENKFQQVAYKLGLKIKTNIILFLKRSFSQKLQHPQILNFIQILGKNLDFSAKIIKAIEQKFVESFSVIELQIEKQHINLVNCSLQVLCACGSNPYNQSIILYEVFLQKPYKPSPQVSMISLFNKLTSEQFIKFITSQNDYMMLENGTCNYSSATQNFKTILKHILIKITYFLCLLTTIESKQFYSTQSRRNAIICLLTDDREFPFNKFYLFKSIIPSQFIQTLKDYFSYPIVEKSLIIKTDEKKQIIKNKGYLFSKALFSIIMEGQPTAKSRYLYIGGPWKSGDLSSNFLYTPSRQRDYSKSIFKFFSVTQSSQLYIEIPFLSKTYSTNEEKAELQLIELNTKKRIKIADKKQSFEAQIKYLNIPLVIQYLGSKVQQNIAIKRVSPSPSNKYPSTGYGKGTPSYDSRGRVSPSPPNNKIPSQNIIGFNNMGQNPSQYSSQNVLNTGFSTINQTTNALQLQNLTTQQQGQMRLPQTTETTSGIKPSQYGDHQPISLPIQPPVYPNPYYSANSIQKPLESTIPSVGSTLPYMQMQKINSQDSNGQMRSGSGSAPRSNIPYGGMGYQVQQPYYNGSHQYGINQGHKMSGYDNRAHSPYQQHHKQYTPMQRNYGSQRGQYQQGSYYSQDRGIGGGYGNNYGSMQGQNPRQGGYQQRPYNTGSGQQYNYDYQQNRVNQPVMQNYSPTSANSYPGVGYSGIQQQDERQFDEAILLVTELRGTLPQHLKTDKKNRLNLILHNNIRVQNRVKQYINGLK